MLVLSRKVGETLHIGGDLITVEVRRVAGNRVTLAVDAPREIPIFRGEIRNDPPKGLVDPLDALDHLAANDSVEGA